MSSPTTTDASPGCKTAFTPRPVLTLSGSTSPVSAPFSVEMLSTELSEETMARLGSIDEESDAEAHSSSPPDLSGRLVLVFWQDEPVIYSASMAPSGCVFSPACLGDKFLPTEPAVLIDPRCLSGPASRIDFDTGAISPTSAPEAADASHTTSHKKSSGTIQHSSAAGGKGNGGSGGDKSGGDKTPGGGKGSGGKGDHPSSHISYNAGISSAIDGLVELPQMVIGAVEFLTYFPRHTQWPTIIFRLYRNGWSTGAMAKAMLHARGTLDRAEWDRRNGALRHQLRTAVRNKYGANAKASELSAQGHPDFIPFSAHPSGNNVDLYDVRCPIEPSGDTYDPPRNLNALVEPARLQDVINGVVNWPTGNDAGQLTHALRYAQQNGLLGQTTRDLPAIIFAQNLAVAADASGTDWDLRAVERLNNAVANP